jgi:hypothetical protein
MNVALLVVAVVLPSGIAALVAGFFDANLRGWLAAVVGLVVLLLLALAALWRRTPLPAIDLALSPSSVQDKAILGSGGHHGRYLHVQVRSNAPIERDTCTGELILVETHDGSAFVIEPEFKPPEYLTWDGVSTTEWPYRIDPQHELWGRLNVVYAVSYIPGQALLAVPREAQVPHGNLIALVPGTYRLTICVHALGYADALARVIITVKGPWDQLTMEAA